MRNKQKISRAHVIYCAVSSTGCSAGTWVVGKHLWTHLMLICLTWYISICCFIDCQMPQLPKCFFFDGLHLETITTASFQCPQILIFVLDLENVTSMNCWLCHISQVPYECVIIFSCFHSLLWAKRCKSSQLSHLLSCSGFHALLMVQLQFYAQLTVLFILPCIFSPTLSLVLTACLFCCTSPRKV